MELPKPSSFQKVKKGAFVILSLTFVGVILGALGTLYYMDGSTLISLSKLNRAHLYEQEYHRSKFYQDNLWAKGSNPFDIDTTIRRLYESFPRVDTELGKDNILQMWKKKPEDCKEGEYPNTEIYERWQTLNPHSNFTFYTNAQVDQIIKRTFINTVPEVWEAYRLLPKIILQSDFGRYLLVFLEGGTYSDIDVYPHRPVDTWVDSYVNQDVGVVISVEGDPNEDTWQNVMPRRLQFLQWTFKTKRRHPAFARLIANIVKVTFQAQVDNKLTAYFHQFADDSLDPCSSVNVMDWTGPGIFTDTMYEYFNTIQNLEIVDMANYRYNTGEQLYGPAVGKDEKINWKLFSGLDHPIILDDVMVLPLRGFKADGECTDYCYVSHRFSGSWKSGNI